MREEHGLGSDSLTDLGECRMKNICMNCTPVRATSDRELLVMVGLRACKSSRYSFFYPIKY